MGFSFKKVCLVLLLLFLCFSLSAASFLSDISLRIGHSAFLSENGEYGLSLLGGASFGLSERLELNVEAVTKFLPSVFSETAVGVEAGYSILGNRTNKSGNAGFHLNSIISAGFFFSDHNGKFAPTYITLRLTPVAFGTPHSGSRQSLLPIGAAYNLRDKSFSLFFGVTIYDYYIKGSWRDNR